MELDPEEFAMLTRLVNFFLESEKNSSIDYSWIAAMCAVSDHMPTNLRRYGASDFNRKEDIRNFLADIYLNRREKFHELLNEIIKPAMENFKQLSFNRNEYGICIVDYEEKIAELNRYLSVFGYELEENLKLKTTSEIIDKRREDRAFVFTELENNYPAEYTALKGAIERYANGGTDSFRQCLDSCRNLIENLIKKMTNTTNWREGLRQIIQSQRKQKLIIEIHAFLSAYGVHGGGILEQKDTELGLKVTEDCIVYITKSKI
jgi:uncharacterized UPF0160 family protein